MNNGNNFRYKIAQFMAGRNGFDMLSKDLIYLSLILMIINLFISNTYFSFIIWIPIIISYVRAFSRNTAKRYQENVWYYNHIRKHLNLRTNFKSKDRTYKYFKCPTCGQKLRAPRGKGKIRVTCSNCHTEFIKRV